MNKLIGVVASLALILSIVGLVGGNQSEPNLGGATRFPNSDLSAKTITSNGVFTSTGLITGAAGAVLTTSNLATSTLAVGCVQTYATSTTTAVRIVLSSAASTTPTFGAGNANGGVSWQYGTCPI